MKFWTAYWSTGEKVFAFGENITDALLLSEITQSKIDCVDFYLEGLDFSYCYNKTSRTWLKNKHAPEYVDLYSVAVNTKTFTPMHVWVVLMDPRTTGVNPHIEGKKLMARCEDVQTLWAIRFQKESVK